MKMKIEYKHSLKKEDSIDFGNKVLDELMEQYSTKIGESTRNWNDDKSKMDFSIEILGYNAKGSVEIEDYKLTINGDVPFLFKNKVETQIRNTLDDKFSKYK